MRYFKTTRHVRGKSIRNIDHKQPSQPLIVFLVSIVSILHYPKTFERTCIEILHPFYNEM